MIRRSALRQLINRARGPLGPSVDVDFGSPGGPFAELGAILSEVNGFFLFNAGVHLFRSGSDGLGYDLATWNDPQVWRDGYGDLIDRETFVFAQDLYGWQFGITGTFTVVLMNPETGTAEGTWQSIEDWAAWLLSDEDAHGKRNDATAWQDRFGPLQLTDRLIHRQLLVFGGEQEVDNLVVKDAVDCMRIRGPIATTIKRVPNGAELRLEVR